MFKTSVWLSFLKIVGWVFVIFLFALYIKFVEQEAKTVTVVDVGFQHYYPIFTVCDTEANNLSTRPNRSAKEHLLETKNVDGNKFKEHKATFHAFYVRGDRDFRLVKCYSVNSLGEKPTSIPEFVVRVHQPLRQYDVFMHDPQNFPFIIYREPTVKILKGEDDIAEYFELETTKILHYQQCQNVTATHVVPHLKPNCFTNLCRGASCPAEERIRKIRQSLAQCDPNRNFIFMGLFIECLLRNKNVTARYCAMTVIKEPCFLKEHRVARRPQMLTKPELDVLRKKNISKEITIQYKTNISLIIKDQTTIKQVTYWINFIGGGMGLFFGLSLFNIAEVCKIAADKIKEIIKEKLGKFKESKDKTENDHEKFSYKKLQVDIPLINVILSNPEKGLVTFRLAAVLLYATGVYFTARELYDYLTTTASYASIDVATPEVARMPSFRLCLSGPNHRFCQYYIKYGYTYRETMENLTAFCAPSFINKNEPFFGAETQWCTGVLSPSKKKTEGRTWRKTAGGIDKELNIVVRSLGNDPDCQRDGTSIDITFEDQSKNWKQVQSYAPTILYACGTHHLIISQQFFADITSACESGQCWTVETNVLGAQRQAWSWKECRANEDIVEIRVRFGSYGYRRFVVEPYQVSAIHLLGSISGWVDITTGVCLVHLATLLYPILNRYMAGKIQNKAACIKSLKQDRSVTKPWADIPRPKSAPGELWKIARRFNSKMRLLRKNEEAENERNVIHAMYMNRTKFTLFRKVFMCALVSAGILMIVRTERDLKNMQEIVEVQAFRNDRWPLPSVVICDKQDNKSRDMGYYKSIHKVDIVVKQNQEKRINPRVMKLVVDTKTATDREKELIYCWVYTASKPKLNAMLKKSEVDLRKLGISIRIKIRHGIQRGITLVDTLNSEIEAAFYNSKEKPFIVRQGQYLEFRVAKLDIQRASCTCPPEKQHCLKTDTRKERSKCFENCLRNNRVTEHHQKKGREFVKKDELSICMAICTDKLKDVCITRFYTNKIINYDSHTTEATRQQTAKINIFYDKKRYEHIRIKRTSLSWQAWIGIVGAIISMTTGINIPVLVEVIHMWMNRTRGYEKVKKKRKQIVLSHKKRLVRCLTL